MRRHSAAGYTLMELLLAMALFSALSTGLIALLARSSEFLTSGASQTETMDSIQTFAEAFGSDVSTLASRADSDVGIPEVRLYCDFANSDTDGDKKPDLTIQRLFFVRTIPDELSLETGWRSGITVGAKDYVNGIGPDEKKAADGTLRASGGLMEVFWTALPDPGAPPNSGVMQIWRGFRAPPGGPGSLLPLKGGRDMTATPAERGIVDAVQVRAVAKPVLSGVLYFGVDFWGRHTTTWDGKVRNRDGGPFRTWDSTRGILPLGEDDIDTFYLSKKKSPQDTDSLYDTTDDTYPRKIRVTCVVEELGRNARVGYLNDDLTKDAKSIPCTDTRFFPATETSRRYVKIENEWIEVGTPSNGAFPVLQRGARNTVAAAHATSAAIHHGRTFVQEYDVATFRDTYRDELGAQTGRGGYGK
jgi:prepilin-type N-terminal cleavage/methylation domain-containing protein